MANVKDYSCIECGSQDGQPNVAGVEDWYWLERDAVRIGPFCKPTCCQLGGRHFGYLAHLIETRNIYTSRPRVDMDDYQATEPGLPKDWPRKGQEKTPEVSRTCPQCGQRQGNIPINQVWVTCNRDNCRHRYIADRSVFQKGGV